MGTNIGEDGAAAIGSLLAATTSLKWLSVARNNIGEAGCAAIAKGLETNTSLLKIQLNACNITGVALAKALETNATLRSCHLEGNSLDEGIQSKIETLLSQ